MERGTRLGLCSRAQQLAESGIRRGYGAMTDHSQAYQRLGTCLASLATWARAVCNA
jgi:hypothetical protein